MRWRPWLPACLAWGCVAALCGSRGLCPAPNASRPEPGQCPRRRAAELCAWALSSDSLLGTACPVRGLCTPVLPCTQALYSCTALYPGSVLLSCPALLLVGL